MKGGGTDKALHIGQLTFLFSLHGQSQDVSVDVDTEDVEYPEDAEYEEEEEEEEGEPVSPPSLSFQKGILYSHGVGLTG